MEIAAHICAADNLGVPSSYAAAFDLLERGGIVTQALAEKLRAMARFRNRIVHFHGDVELKRVHAGARGDLDDFERYLAAIEQYLGG